MKVMETVNVVIDESLDSSSENGIEELTKEILPPEVHSKRFEFLRQNIGVISIG